MTAMMANGIYLPGTGIHTRRKRGGGGGEEPEETEGVILVMLQQSVGAVDYVSCKRVSWDNMVEEWVTTGDAFNVWALFANRGEFSALDEAVPRLYNGDILPAFKAGEYYYFTTVFDASESCDCWEAT